MSTFRHDLLCRRRFLAASVAAAAVGASPVAAQQPQRIIDTYAHIFERGLPLAPGARYTVDYDAPVSAYLAQMDANGITHGVLVQISFLGTDNSYVLQGIAAAPTRLRGIAVVDPAIPRSELAAMDRAGIVGVRLNLVGRPIPDFTTKQWREHLAHVRDLGWQVEVHREAKDLPAIVGPLLDAGVNVVVDHFGRPDGTLGVNDPGFRYLLTKGDTRRLWVKVSAAYRNGRDGAGERTAFEAYPMLRDALGVDRLLFAADWPHTTFETAVSMASERAAFERMVADPVERRQIMDTNAAALFRF